MLRAAADRRPARDDAGVSRRQPLLLAGLIGLGVLLDQWTKSWAHAQVRGRGVISVIEGVFDLRYARNPGAFFGLGAGLAPGIRRAAFAVVTLLTIGLIAHLYRHSRQHQGRLRLGLAFLVAGALGNLVDRLRAGEVIDFLHLHWYESFHWATFNVADIWITVGLGLLVLDGWQKSPVDTTQPLTTTMPQTTHDPTLAEPAENQDGTAA